VAHCPDGRTALQRTGREAHRAAEEVLGKHSENSRRLTLGELSTVVAEAAQAVNSRPIAKNTGDPETGGPITPLHLQLGRATVEVPKMKPDSKTAVHRRSKEAVLEEVDAAGI
jgi:hypothetical protein